VSNDDPLLTAALRGIAEDDRRAGSSGAVEARLREEFHAVSRAQRSARRRYAMFAAAAALVAAIAIPAWRLSRRSAISGTGSASLSGERSRSAVSALQAREIVTDFLPLAYSDVPISGGQIVRLEVPRTALASFGLTPPDAAADIRSTDTVLADVLVGDDGLARAVRFVRSGP